MMMRLVNETVQMGGQGCSALLQPLHVTFHAWENGDACGHPVPWVTAVQPFASLVFL